MQRYRTANEGLTLIGRVRVVRVRAIISRNQSQVSVQRQTPDVSSQRATRDSVN